MSHTAPVGGEITGPGKREAPGVGVWPGSPLSEGIEASDVHGRKGAKAPQEHAGAGHREPPVAGSGANAGGPQELPGVVDELV